MKRKSMLSELVIFILFVGLTSASYAELLEGRVYEGQTGTEPPPLGDAKPIEGATVSLYGSGDENDDGTGQGRLPIQTTTTNADGWYSLTVRGAYDFYNIIQTNLQGYVDSDPSPAATSVGGTVKSSNWIQYRYEDLSGTTTGNKFWDKKEGEEPPAGTVIIRGVKYNDLNDNGKREPNEPGLPNWEITLEDGNNNLLATTSTGANGEYSFTITEPGTYIIDEVQQSGWRQTDPVRLDGTPLTPSWTFSVLPPYYEYDDIDFGNHQEEVSPTEEWDFGDAPSPYPDASHELGGPWLGSIPPDADPGTQPIPPGEGDDNDADGDDEDGLLSINLVKTAGTWSTWEIKLYLGPSSDARYGLWIDFNGDGDWDDPDEAQPSWGFCGYKPGDPQNWFHCWSTFPLPNQAKVGTTYARLRVYNNCNAVVSPSGAGGPGEVEDYLVEIKADGPGVPPGGIVHGYKWNDVNGDKFWDPGEPALPGWIIWLDTNQNGVEDAGDMYEQTDTTGHFRFTGVPAGTYTLGEQQQTGWTQTYPGGSGTHTVTVDPNSPSLSILFGNTQGAGPGPGQQFDWGDAPDPNYPTLQASNGAYHVIVPGIFLGGGVDAEVDGQPALDARGDDYGGSDDEDGVIFKTPIMPGQQASVEVLASSAGYLDAWIDFDADGSWSQASDQIFTSEPILAGSNILSFQVPASIAINIDTYARFRFSTTGALSPYGPAQDGEVEDYHILLGEDGPGVPGEEELPHVKWSQPPIEIDPNVDIQPVFCGWGESAISIKREEEPRRWRIDLDDFHCLGPIPVTRIRWWGSYKEWESPELPEEQPISWRIAFWANTPDDIEEARLMPERPVWLLEIPTERVHIEPVGFDEFPQKPSDTCFLYEVKLEPEEFFHQGDFESEDDIFWISITAVYPDYMVPADHPWWGWKTRPHVWRDNAMVFVLDGEGINPDFVVDPDRHLLFSVENELLCDRLQGYDFCFELLTEQPWIKWDQPFTGMREWPHYEDHESYAIEDPNGDVLIGQRVSDDWLCERRNPVIAVAWNGSYMGYGYEACACENSAKPISPDYFVLTLRTNAPADANIPNDHPGPKIWEYEAIEFDEVLVGFDKHPHGEPNEAVFRYMVRLPEDTWFRQEASNQIYWFSVMAVYQGANVDTIMYPWAWTNHRYTFGSTALGLVFTDQGTQPNHLYDQTDERIDMSFTLYTLPEPLSLE